MNIALDYDDTYTADRVFWEGVWNYALSFGHRIYIVTMRNQVIDLNQELQHMIADVVWCDGRPKREVCEEQGIHIDIWIDDKPEGIDKGSSFSPEQLAEWRKEKGIILPVPSDLQSV